MDAQSYARGRCRIFQKKKRENRSRLRMEDHHASGALARLGAMADGLFSCSAADPIAFDKAGGQAPPAQAPVTEPPAPAPTSGALEVGLKAPICSEIAAARALFSSRQMTLS